MDNLIEYINYKLSKRDHIGKYIAMYRHRRNMTQETLALFVGVKKTTVSMWECCKRVPNRDDYIKLCFVLNMPFDLFPIYLQSYYI